MTELDDRTPPAVPLGPTTSGPSRSGPGKPGPNRRQVLVTGGVVVAAAAVTTACGSSASSVASPGSGGPVTVATSDIPVGGGKVFEAQQIVVTQPVAGTFKAFDATCTHQGCTVAKVAAGVITCPCHNSQFSATDGSVKAGPAPAPLASVPLTVNGTEITVQGS
jgi:Rieske Fe-S protein